MAGLRDTYPQGLRSGEQQTASFVDTPRPAQPSGLQLLAPERTEPLPIQRFAGPIYAPSVWMTQIYGALEENIRALEHRLNPNRYPEAQFRLPEFSPYESAIMGDYEDTGDIGRSLSYLGRLNPLYSIEGAIRGPETDENQFYTSGRAFLPDADEVEMIAKGLELLRPHLPDSMANKATWTQFILGFASEQNIAEMIYDPFNVADAFGAGTKLMNGLNSVGGKARAASPLLDRGIQGAANLVDTAFDMSWRRVRQAAHPFMGEAATATTEVGRGLRQREASIRETVGGTWQTDFYGEEIAPRITDLIETTPEEVVNNQILIGRMFGPEEAAEDAVSLVGNVFPDIPEEAKYQIADFLNYAWDNSRRYPEIENFMGINTAELAANTRYIYHSMTPEARRAMLGSIPDWFQKVKFKYEDVVGKVLTSTMRKREWRSTVAEANRLASEGRFGFVKGEPIWLNSVDDAPEGFVAVNKIFDDNPFNLLFQRNKMHTQALSGAQMLRELSQNPEFVKAPTANAPTLFEMMGEPEFKRTFGRLSEDLQEIARNTKWKDKGTAEGILEFFRVSQDLDTGLSGMRRMFENVLTGWRGMTLLPFVSYHSRNVVGGLLNGFMSGKMDILDVIDAMYPTRGTTGAEWEQYRKAGMDSLTNMAVDFGQIDSHVYDKPLYGTPLQNYWYYAKQYNPFGEGGRSVGQALENHQRFALWLGARRRGEDALKAAETVNRYMFDYGDVPRWFAHGTGMRQLAAFPVWTLKNIPLQLRHLIETPSWFSKQGILMNSMIRASGREDEPMPEYIEQMGGFPIPGGGYFAPQNFLPSGSLFEIYQMMEPLMQGDTKEALGQVGEFVEGLLNPFVSAPIELATPTAELDTNEQMRLRAPTLPGMPESDATGWDWFTSRPILSEYKQWNPLLEYIGVEGEMPDWAQRLDHVARSFVRAYGEISGTLREAQKAMEGQSEYTVGEYGVRRLAGVPVYQANPMQTVYFANRDVTRDIAAVQNNISEGEASEDQLTDLKDLYMRKLGYLAHGTFMQVDPFSGEARPWLDLPQDDDFTRKGRQQYYRDYIETSYLMLYGRTGMGNQYRHQPVPLTADEREFVELMMDSAIKAYMTEAIAGVTEGGDFGSEMNWLEDRMVAPPPTE